MESREYQLRISEVASEANTLVVLPTGLGKTMIAILVAERRLRGRADAKVVVLAPTRPLVVQHHAAFSRDFTSSICDYEWQPKRNPGEIRECPRCNSRKWKGNSTI